MKRSSEVKHTCGEGNLRWDKDYMALMAEVEDGGPPGSESRGSSKMSAAHRNCLNQASSPGIFQMDRLNYQGKEESQFEGRVDSPSPVNSDGSGNTETSMWAPPIPGVLVNPPTSRSEKKDGNPKYLDCGHPFMTRSPLGLHCQERGHDCLTDLATVNPDEFNRTLFKVPSATSQTPLMMADEAGTPPGSPVAPLAPPSDDATLEAASGDHSSRKGDRGPKNDGEGHPLLPRSRTSPVEDDGGSRLEASHICTNPYLTAENVRKPVPSPNNCSEETQAIQIVLSGSSGSGSLRNNGSSSMSGKGHTRGHQKGPSPSTSNGGSATRFGCTWSSLCGRNPKKVTTMLAAFTSVWVLYVIMLHFKKEVDAMDARATLMAKDLAELKTASAAESQRLSKEIKELVAQLKRRHLSRPQAIPKRPKGSSKGSSGGSKPFSVSSGSQIAGVGGGPPKPFGVPEVAKCETESGARCIFPFYYKGNKYTTCVTTWNYRRPWCAIKVDKNQAMPALEASSWDYCQTTCPSISN